MECPMVIKEAVFGSKKDWYRSPMKFNLSSSKVDNTIAKKIRGTAFDVKNKYHIKAMLDSQGIKYTKSPNVSSTPKITSSRPTRSVSTYRNPGKSISDTKIK